MSKTQKTTYYPNVELKPDFPRIEQDILSQWEKNKTFDESIDRTKDKTPFIFFDGPPFANGLPHYGHILTGFVKDLIPRYQTMKNKYVERGLGWDCHGLPAEMEAEKELGISGRERIRHYGIDKFNDHCRTSVLKYTQQWRNTMTRQGRWVDFNQEYKTQDLSYMESIIWAFKTLHDKGLLYEDVRVLAYSWAAETPVSNFETRLDNSYRKRTDPAIMVAFELNDDRLKRPRKLVAWTTTPWTLPSNLALAVGPDIDYGIFVHEDVEYVFSPHAKDKLKDIFGSQEPMEIIKGHDLIGCKYHPLFDYFPAKKNSHQILSGDFVSDNDGTGIVHLAPGFGEDDFHLCREHNIDIVCPVNDQGKFTSQISDYEGLLVFDANQPIIKDLKKRHLILKHENYTHNYPHCWRTDEPLIYRAMPSWFLKASDLSQRMKELNQTVNWIPHHIRDGAFGNWIEGSKDWSISRQRFWGAPLPVWKSDDPKYPRIDIYGSLDEIERDFKRRPKDLHRPHIDEFVRPNPDDPTGKSQMRRVEDVFDCWFESGAMPFAHRHYPFENEQAFHQHPSADFIVEYVAQVRGWFYTLFVLSTALFDKVPFKNVICHGVVLDENQQKLSKRLKNYPEPEVIFNQLGSDNLRWFLMSSPILKGANLSIDKDGSNIAKSSRDLLLPLWNAFYFFCLYANSEGIKAKIHWQPDQVLDQYILLKTQQLLNKVEENLDEYKINVACSEIVTYMDVLNNWYIRRSRSRFWDGKNHQQAFDTLYTVLTTLSQMLAPFIPFTADYIFQALHPGQSVHLQNWPHINKLVCQDHIREGMDYARDVCSSAKLIREQNQLRVRQPLASLTLIGENLRKVQPFEDLIKDETNVKEIIYKDDLTAYAEKTLFIDRYKVGARLGKKMKNVLAALKANEWTYDPENQTVHIASQCLTGDEFDMRLKPIDHFKGQPISDNTALIDLDICVTDELKKEGLARDFIRNIQNIRKEKNLDVTTRIHLNVYLEDGKVYQALQEHRQEIQNQVLALNLNLSHHCVGPEQYQFKLDQINVSCQLNLDSSS